MQRSIRLAGVVFLVLVFLTGPRSTIAAQQDAANPFTDLGLPEIAVTITDSALEIDSAELDAGRYALSVTNESGMDDLGVGFMQPPEGMTVDEVIDLVSSMAGPPAAGGDASPAASEGGPPEGPPPFYYEALLAGGIYAADGETSHVVIDLTEGEWMLWAEDPTLPQAPVKVTVTGEMPADLPEPEADVTVTGVEMAFEIEGTFTAGPQIVEFVNGGDQPHFLIMLNVPDGTTVDDFLALSATFGDPTASPPPGLSFEDITTGLDTADISSGVTMWVAADLDPGTYIAACFITDPETGAPHAMLGMIDIVVVE